MQNKQTKLTTTFLDGAMGTQMQLRGMPGNVCPETWAIEHPEALKQTYQAYIDAGSQNLLTFTFGASRYKLREYNLEDQTQHINQTLAEIARATAPKDVQIGGDIGPLGSLIEPLGEIPFEEAVLMFREQATALEAGGVDYIAIETMIDIREARAALIGAREGCNLPIRVTLTFENGHTLTGTTPAAAAVTLQSLGASVIGSNCGAGPIQMLPVIEEMTPFAHVPLIAKPNAGLPRLVDGITVYDMGPEDFAIHGEKLVQAGARYIGGCCGSTPEHIQALSERMNGLFFLSPAIHSSEFLSSARYTLEFTDTLIMGDINLASEFHEKWREAALDQDFDDILDFIDDIPDAQLLCLSIGTDSPTEEVELRLWADLTDAISNYSSLPMAFRPSSAAATELILRRYPGRALIFSDQAASDQERLAMLGLIDYYGAIIL